MVRAREDQSKSCSQEPCYRCSGTLRCIFPRTLLSVQWNRKVHLPSRPPVSFMKIVAFLTQEFHTLLSPGTYLHKLNTFMFCRKIGYTEPERAKGFQDSSQARRCQTVLMAKSQDVWEEKMTDNRFLIRIKACYMPSVCQSIAPCACVCVCVCACQLCATIDETLLL